MPEPEIIEPFLEALRVRDIDEAERLLRATPELVHVPDPECFDYRVLDYGAWFNQRRLVDLALEHGADLDAPVKFWAGDWTALELALAAHNTSLAEHLAERGAHVGVHGAAGLGHADRLIEILDEAPEMVLQRGGDGMHPLHIAATPEIAGLLLDRGAQVDARCIDHHSTPAQWAAEHRPEVARYLVSRGAEPDIFMAALGGDVAWVRELVEANPEVVQERITLERFPGPEGIYGLYFFSLALGENATPLHTSAARNHPALVDFFLDAGLEPDIRGGYDDATPLHSAAWHNASEAAARLIDRGATVNIDSGEIHENSPLGWAVVSGSVDTARVLIERGAQKLDYHLRDARMGLDGAFRHYVNAFEPEHYRDLIRLLESE